MKKGTSKPQLRQETPDITGIISTMQQQLAVLDRKLDTLLNRSSQRPFDTRQFSAPAQHFEQPNRQPETRQNNGFKERILYKAVCADCSKECEIPFNPASGRPVYCKECYAKRRNGSAAIQVNYKATASLRQPAQPVAK
ncbi:MAG: hypothetical protein NC933_05590, partial [Candidatus Omnitrophica bacterium]|nr:hypothetical protein [Candidatus Omnitrophota bacterium]